MADHTTIARPYASALFQVARERGELAQWSATLTVLASALADDALQAWLERPSLTDGDRTAFLLDIATAADPAAGALLTADRGANFLKLLAENDRLAILPEIAALFEALRHQEENTMDVTMVAASDVDASTQSAITAALESRLGRSVRLSVNVDPGLLGGAVIRADDLVIDASLKSRLAKLATSLIR